MSVYISGLELPQEGRITLQIDSNGGVYVVNKFSITSEKYEKSMPATEIQSHGRLIDIKSVEDGKFHAVGNDCQRWWNGALESVIDNAPTVIEAED